MQDKSASEQIDDIIKMHAGWKGETLSSLSTAITQADTGIVEEIKWRMASRPEGLPVWSHDGIVCFAETWKDNIKLLFPKGSSLKDPHQLFNARLESKTTRAIEFKEGNIVNTPALRELVSEAIIINSSKSN